MKILSIQPKDIYVTFEMSLHEVDLLLEFLDHCEVKYNTKKDDKMIKADNYVKEVFADLTEMYVDLTSGKGGTN